MASTNRGDEEPTASARPDTDVTDPTVDPGAERREPQTIEPGVDDSDLAEAGGGEEKRSGRRPEGPAHPVRGRRFRRSNGPGASSQKTISPIPPRR